MSYMPLASQPCRRKGRIARVTRRAPAKSFVSETLQLWDNDPATTLHLLSTAASQMPIDYSRFDNIDVSDDEDEQAYKARKEAEEAGRASKAQAKEAEAWWQACPKQSQFTVEVRRSRAPARRRSIPSPGL